MLVKKKGAETLLQVIQAGCWQGLVPLKPDEIVEVENPLNRWTGPKRTILQHQQVLSFFEKQYAEHKNEAMAHWFVNEERGEWQVLVLPQRGMGMTVNILADHELYIPTFQRLGPGWEPMGTDHHHCDSGAFQSGTDHKDEQTKEGLHLTIGGIGKERYTLDARSSFRQCIMPVRLTDWYELPPEYASLPGYLQEQILKHLLTTPANVEFPDWWLGQIIPYRQQQNIIYGYGQGNIGVNTPSSLWHKENGKWVNDKSEQWALSRADDTRLAKASAWDDRVDEAVAKFMSDHELTIDQMDDWLVKLQENGTLMDLLDVMDEAYCDIPEIIASLLRLEDAAAEAAFDQRTTADGGFVIQD